MDIIDRIELLRKSKKMSSSELAALIGKTKSTISNWKNRTSKPTVEQLIMLSDYFDVSIDYLATGKEKSLSEEDNKILSKYKVADNGTKAAVNKLLDIDVSMGKSSELKIG